MKTAHDFQFIGMALILVCQPQRELLLLFVFATKKGSDGVPSERFFKIFTSQSGFTGAIWEKIWTSS
jgi:hypothetical protein